ncbi:uncharacterized protein PV07_07342 [Cladophialophora immunda]|uniref:glycerophosphodiester phosphodiesterase n=1 Tax=Cladophialophora immunda TaxID=569365 RepID=A0A0D2ARA3_9EURO|nr:uncharacterized protein PV07_07342 [Cladophialophora immunda]KIW27617.1 hypothetical protein PV07_07342 [Cladophialophora immunda]OQU97330.1 hypothetical protein CLAIMM_03276 [Cladophialophora immunda]
MRATTGSLAMMALAADIAGAVPVHKPRWQHPAQDDYYISLGPRPYYLIQNMTDGPLKQKLESCYNGPFEVTTWSIGHRGGGTLQFPEESVESTMAGARMGAGILECDVSFTSDLGLVCRHSLCDLHTTTDILLRPELAAKCTVPFTPANETADANALCCTSDITEAEYTTLCSKMDGFNASATTPEDYQHGTPSFRTDLYNTCAQVMTLESYIDLVESLPGYRNFTPELKTPPSQVPMPFHGYTQAQYARDMLDTFIRKGISHERVWPQSFNPADIYLWLNEYPAWGAQAVFLDEDGDVASNFSTAVARLPALKASGVNIISPPYNYLLDRGGPDNNTIVPSIYATTAMAAGLDIIAWSFERSGPLDQVRADADYYWSSIADIISYDGQEYEALDVLARQIGVKAMFSDWSATVTYYANCMGLKGPGHY